MRNIKLTLEYDGSNYCGWQWQPDDNTVQKTLHSAIKSVMNDEPTLIAAGRTDSGVHALGQVVNFKTNSHLGLDAIKNGINRYLPNDVLVLAAEEAAADFHARFSATKRVYRYVIAKTRRAVGRQYAWYCKYRLELERIKTASEYLVGEHVFAVFSKETEDEPHYLSYVESAEWSETERDLIFRICAKRFLHNMVRMIVGTLVEVGRGKYEPDIIEELLESGDKSRTGATAPPHGLFLEKIYYN
ncbi:MAG: tRNA pseudouridine(38-40) synthase TruA [bacterium]